MRKELIDILQNGDWCLFWYNDCLCQENNNLYVGQISQIEKSVCVIDFYKIFHIPSKKRYPNPVTISIKDIIKIIKH